MKKIDAETIILELTMDHKMVRSPILLNKDFAVPSHRWLTSKFVPFWKDYLFDLGLPQRGPWECENYAFIALAQSRIAGLWTNVIENPAFGLLIIQETAQKGAQVGQIVHAINIVRTNKGWYEFEPQKADVRPLRTSGIFYVLM
jgi:hypothetical protein